MSDVPRLLAIDPGNDTGWAAFRLEDGALEACGVVTPNDPIGRFAEDPPAVVVIELPRVRMRGKASPDSIISLATKVGRYEERYGGPAGRHAEVWKVWPEEWKGSIDGDVFLNRIEADLTPAEREVVGRYRGAAKIRHNMIDAVGLGKWSLNKRRLDAALRSA